MSDYTCREYWEEVAMLASEVADNIRDHGADQHDATHEAVDGSAWIIYHAGALQCLVHTTNKTACEDIKKGADLCADFWKAVTVAAYYALCADVADYLGNHLELIPDDDDDDDDRGSQ